MSTKKIVLGTLAAIVLVSAILALREYLLLKKIERMLALPSLPESTVGDAPSKKAQAKLENADAAMPTAQASEENPYIYAVRREGQTVSARARFAAFKKAVEASPEILRAWGALRWKVLDDTPALCIRNLQKKTPFSALGVVSGECITHIDGETVNQPTRNLGIWLMLGARSQIQIDTLRQGRKMTYRLQRG